MRSIPLKAALAAMIVAIPLTGAFAAFVARRGP